MVAKEKRLAQLRASINEITPVEAQRRQSKGAELVDVREPDEVAAGSPLGAHRIVRGFLELRIEGSVPDLSKEVMVMCAGGVRSLFAAENLSQLGYSKVSSITGGFNRWKNDSLPVEIPPQLTANERERYARHLLMPEVGEKGQLKLINAKVLFVGAGGLGSPAAYYLAAAGVGTIGIVDNDVVDRSNLQRQILHTDDRVGMAKVKSAEITLKALNPAVKVVAHETRLDSSNVEDIFKAYDIVVDGSDNFPTRYLVNDACVKLRKPNVHGSIFRFEGQVSVFWPDNPKEPSPCYRCLYPEPPPPEMAPSCAEAGVLGILPGVVGLLEAVEAVKIILGIGDTLAGRLLHYDALRARFTELQLDRDPDCTYCSGKNEFPGYIDYVQFCTTAAAQ
jgi:sulfur-carrier protein adenylyltransferase/sulfurtransferase